MEHRGQPSQQTDWTSPVTQVQPGGELSAPARPDSAASQAGLEQQQQQPQPGPATAAASPQQLSRYLAQPARPAPAKPVCAGRRQSCDPARRLAGKALYVVVLVSVISGTAGRHCVTSCSDLHPPHLPASPESWSTVISCYPHQLSDLTPTKRLQISYRKWTGS